jgi:uncharacterized protein DUF397
MPTSDCRDGWRKSSFSDQGNGCVEIAHTLGAVRDSKNPDGPVLSVDVRGLVARAKSR